MLKLPASPSSTAVVSGLLAVFIGCLTGCGGGSSAPAPVAATSTPVAANWQMNVEAGSGIPTPPTNPILNLYGSLTLDSGKITGVLNGKPGFPSTCSTGITDLAVSGTADAAGNYSLSFPIAGGTAQVQFAPNPPHLGYLGTYQVTGGNCAQSRIALSAYQVPSVSGTYSGTLQAFSGPTGPTGATSTVTATLTEAANPTADGTYTLSGTVTVTGACTDSLMFNTGLVTGDSFASQYLAFTLPAPSGPQFSGAIDPTSTGAARSVIGGFFDNTACPGVHLSGVLTRQ